MAEVEAEQPMVEASEGQSEAKKWRVIGGSEKGGILVRAGEDKESEELPRLATGADIEQIELKKDRLHFKKLTGEGPDEGWVSLKAGGKPLVARIGAPPVPKQVAAKKEMAGKPRVLCLHGTASGKLIMDIQFGKLWKEWAKDIDHYVLEGMKSVANKPKTAGAESIEIMSQFFPGKPMMQYDELVFDDKNWRCYKKTADTLFWLQSMIKKHGPFDGVLGFSQGANFAVMLAAQSFCGKGAGLSFIVACCPNAPGYVNQAPELFQEPIGTPALIIRGAEEKYDEGVQKTLKGKDIDECGESMCSEHVGKLFKDPKLHTHPDGHRPMPAKPDDQQELMKTIIEFVLEKAPLAPVTK